MVTKHMSLLNMFPHIKVRGPVLFALIFAISAFILSLLVLLAGSTPSFLVEAYIVLYDTSSLATNQASTNTTTTTGIYDWYSFYYLSICYGSWTNDTTSSRTKTNISCSHQPPGYQLSITNYLPAAAATLVDNDSYTIRARDPAAYCATWLAGTILTGIASVLLPMLLQGKIHMNGYVVFILILANLALLVGAILTTLDAQELAETQAQYSRLGLGLMWAAVGGGVVALGAEVVEWSLQRWTPKGERVNARWRASGVPSIRSESFGRSGRSNRSWRIWV